MVDITLTAKPVTIKFKNLEIGDWFFYPCRDRENLYIKVSDDEGLHIRTSQLYDFDLGEDTFKVPDSNVSIDITL